jgi:hypothetical protein
MQFHSPSGLHEPLGAPFVEGRPSGDGCVLGLEATVDGDDEAGIGEASGTKTPRAPEEPE